LDNQAKRAFLVWLMQFSLILCTGEKGRWNRNTTNGEVSSKLVLNADMPVILAGG